MSREPTAAPAREPGSSARGTPPRALSGVAIGLAGGLAAGLFGIGGGLVVVPLLVLASGVDLKRAVGTSLAAMVPVALVGVATEALVAPANLRWTAAVAVAVGSLAGAAAGTRLAVRLGTPLLARLLAALLLLAALRLSGIAAAILRVLGLDVPVPDLDAMRFLAPEGFPPPGVPLPGFALRGAEGVLGLAAGVLSALFGIGGGILVVPGLDALHPSWGFHACRATSLAVIVPAATLGALLHSRHGHVSLGVAFALAPGSILGSVAGVVLANAAPARWLETAFATLLALAALRLARGGRTNAGRAVPASSPAVGG